MADHEVGHVDVRLVIAVIEGRDHQEVGVRLGDAHALRLNRGGQAGQGLLHLVLDLDLGDVGVGALGKGGGDGHRACRAGGRVEIEQPVKAGQLLLDHLRHAAFQRGGRRARIGGVDVHLWRGNIGELLDRQAIRAPTPIIMVMMAMTQAKIGRSIKMRDMDQPYFAPAAPFLPSL
jgi:hypothetical protein